MPEPFALKAYQTQTLDALRRYLERTVELNDAGTASYQLTKHAYVAPPGLPGLPYVCLRVPTGGGKTLLAAHTVAIAADSFLRVPNPVALWLTPSQTIRDQTLKSLQDRDNPNRRALAGRFGACGVHAPGWRRPRGSAPARSADPRHLPAGAGARGAGYRPQVARAVAHDR